MKLFNIKNTQVSTNGTTWVDVVGTAKMKVDFDSTHELLKGDGIILDGWTEVDNAKVSIDLVAITPEALAIMTATTTTANKTTVVANSRFPHFQLRTISLDSDGEVGEEKQISFDKCLLTEHPGIEFEQKKWASSGLDFIAYGSNIVEIGAKTV